MFVSSFIIGGVFGAIPGGRLVAMAAHDKVLTQGTGNPGPFLWLQKGKYGLASLCFFLEAGKIVAAIQMAWWLTSSHEASLVAGVLAIFAHGHSPFLRWIPCRSSAVYLGFAFGLYWGAGGALSGILLFTILFFLWQNKGQYQACNDALLILLLALPAVLFFLMGTNPALAGMVICVYGLWHHKRQILIMRNFS